MEEEAFVVGDMNTFFDAFDVAARRGVEEDLEIRFLECYFSVLCEEALGLGGVFAGTCADDVHVFFFSGEIGKCFFVDGGKAFPAGEDGDLRGRSFGFLGDR